MNVQRVYSVVFLLINSIGSKRFNSKVQTMHKTIWDKICPEKQQQNVFLCPSYTCLKIMKTFRRTEDEKFQLQLKSQLIRSYIIKTKNQTVHRLGVGIKSPNRNSNFVKPKWVKLGNLLKIPETKLRKHYLVTARGHKENQK